jgi:hypothetical protein
MDFEEYIKISLPKPADTLATAAAGFPVFDTYTSDWIKARLDDCLSVLDEANKTVSKKLLGKFSGRKVTPAKFEERFKKAFDADYGRSVAASAKRWKQVMEQAAEAVKPLLAAGGDAAKLARLAIADFQGTMIDHAAAARLGAAIDNANAAARAYCAQGGKVESAQQTAKDIKAARTAAEKARAAVEAQTPTAEQTAEGVKFLVEYREKKIAENRKTGAGNRKSGLEWTGELENANTQADAKTAAFGRINAAGNGYGDKKQAIAREAAKLGMKPDTLRREFYRWNAETAGKKKAN